MMQSKIGPVFIIFMQTESLTGQSQPGRLLSPDNPLFDLARTGDGDHYRQKRSGDFADHNRDVDRHSRALTRRQLGGLRCKGGNLFK